MNDNRRSFFKKLGATLAAVSIASKLKAETKQAKKYPETYKKFSLPNNKGLGDLQFSGIVYSMTGQAYTGSYTYIPVSG